MTAITRALNRALSAPGDVDTLKDLALFSGAGLLVSLVSMSYGLNLTV